jgi:hypothetical protein
MKKTPICESSNHVGKKKAIAIEITTRLTIETTISRSCAMEKNPNL